MVESDFIVGIVLTVITIALSIVFNKNKDK